ncbi:MAG: hypothetical protein AMXMBFR84_42330 [Candidatus Hydrogenedentota bacterium]
MFNEIEFWLGLIYVGFPLGLLIYGWNDYVDAETDRLNPRKGTFLFGAKPSDEELKRIPWWMAAVQTPFFLAFAATMGIKALAIIAGLIGFTWLYNARPFGFKNYPILDLTNQTGYLLVFVLSSWINRVPQAPWPVFLFGALFAMHSHLLGATMDIEPDRAAGRRTTANVAGRVRAKGLIALFITCEAMLVHFALGNTALSIALTAAAVGFVLDAVLLQRDNPYPPAQSTAFLMGWNVAAILSAPWIWQNGVFAAPT